MQAGGSSSSNYVNQDLNDVFFTSATKGWAVGSSGKILTTSNGGTTWAEQTSGTTQTLFSVQFTSATQGWAVGGGGTILTTSNGGTTWTAQTSGTTQTLNGVYFTSANQGWVVASGGAILTTSNGGTTWTAQTNPASYGLNSVYFISATQGWAVGNQGTMLTTSNGGTTWTTQTSGTTTGFGSVHFISATQGWAVGSGGSIFTTSNGGTTWTAQTSGTTQPVLSVYFTSATQGWAVGSNGTILTTSNGGTTWTTQTSGTTQTLVSVYFTSATQGWAAGGSGTILTTSNGGTTWTAQTFGTFQTLFGVYFTSNTQGWAVGSGGTILTTSNGGTSWTAQTSGTTQFLKSVYFTSASQGWVVGSAGTILTTSNGGTTWTAQTSGTTNNLEEVYFTSATQGWAVGLSGTILTTSNGGTTQTAQTSGTTNGFNDVYFTSATQGWAVGTNGTIRTTSNGGTTWTAQTSGTTEFFFGVNFTSATQGWVSGTTGTILTTSNGGTTWTAQTSGITSNLLKAYFTSASQGWAVGAGGTILTTSNGGTTWTAQTSGSTQQLNGMYFTSATQGWAVGNSGTILLYGASASNVPVVSTAAAGSISAGAATLGGNVTDSGSTAITQRGIVYATTANPTLANNKVSMGTGLGSFSQNVSGLSASTLYHFRAFAINSTDTAYGADSTFTTAAVPPSFAPTVVTGSPASVSSTAALLGGNVSDSGTASVTERGIVYATTANPTTADNKVTIGSGLGNFSQNVSGLTAATTYHVRAYAINSVGTSYGADSTFTTLNIPTPSIVAVGTLNAFSSCAGSPSDEQSFTVSGTALNDNISVTAPLGFEISNSSGGSFAPSLNLTQSSGNVPLTTLYIRLNNAASGNYGGNISFASTGADSQFLAVSGVVNPVPAMPVISTLPDLPVCAGAEYLNFGASMAPPAGVTYEWTVNNASVYAQGSTRQYALVSFPDSGDAKVILTATQNNCSARTEVTIAVNSQQVHEASVRYFNDNFVCLANLVSAYQWGFDEMPVLNGTKINDEIDQNYFNTAPDLNNKAYWVISTKDGCYQKSYYNIPASVIQAASLSEINVYPNPFSSEITLKADMTDANLVLTDVHGKQLRKVKATGSEVTINLSDLASGVYFIRMIKDGQFSFTKIVKQ